MPIYFPQHTFTNTLRQLKKVKISKLGTSCPSVSCSLCEAKGSLCSWSRYFSRLKNVSKNIGVILHLFRSVSDTLPGTRGRIMSNIWNTNFLQQHCLCCFLPHVSKKNFCSEWINYCSNMWGKLSRQCRLMDRRVTNLFYLFHKSSTHSCILKTFEQTTVSTPRK